MLLRALAVGATAVAIILPASAALADPTPGEVQAQIDNAYNELEDVIEAYNGINETLKTTQATAADIATRLGSIEGQLDEANRSVQHLAAAAYRSGGGLTTASVVLAAGSSESLMDQVTALRFVSRARQQEIADYTRLKERYDADRQRYDQLLAEQTRQQTDLAARKATIEASIKDLEALKKRLNTPPPPPPASTAKPPPVSGKAGAAVNFAYAQLGKPYAYGADGPGSYDCSGLTMAAWAAAGVTLPHNAAMQWNSKAVTHISRAALQPGDLVFYRNLGHVGMYVGSGTIIHAPHTGTVVQTASVDIMTPYGYARPG